MRGHSLSEISISLKTEHRRPIHNIVPCGKNITERINEVLSIYPSVKLKNVSLVSISGYFLNPYE